MVFSHRGEQMGLVVIRHDLTLTVEGITGIIDFSAPDVGNRTGDDVDAQFLCKGTEGGLDPLALTVGERLEVFAGEKADVPGFRQGDNIRPGRSRAPHQLHRMSKVVLGFSELHIHLDCGNSHAEILLLKIW